MGRKLFAPGVEGRSIQIDALAKARSEGALDRLLARPANRSDRLMTSLTHHVYRNPPLPNQSVLGGAEAVVRNYGFKPLTTLVMHTWYAEQLGLECWVDPTGSIVLEVVREDPSSLSSAKDGDRTLITCFTDGTSLVMWSPGADLEALATPTRESMVSCGHFPQDMRNFRSRIAELVGGGKEVLHTWNVASLVRRYELHNRYQVSRGARAAEKLWATRGLVLLALGMLIHFVVGAVVLGWTIGVAMAFGAFLAKLFRRVGLLLRFENWCDQKMGR